MTDQEIIQLGIPLGMAAGFRHMTPAEACTHRCEDCNVILAIHPDARWRFREHVIRCQFCQNRAVMERGYNLQEAMFVE